jgi:hypothetical protein
MARNVHSEKAKATKAPTVKAKAVEGACLNDEKTIRIECRGAMTLPLDSIIEFQGGLKKRGKKEIQQIITSILKYGFSFPFFFWENKGRKFCMDGHGRKAALLEMRKRGYDLPEFPACPIFAKDEAEAKQKLLRNESRYGLMTIEGVLEFSDGLSLDGDELSLPGVELVNVSNKDLAEQDENNVSLDRPYEQIHILLSMPIDAFVKHAEVFKKLRSLSEVEYEQSKN